MHKSKLREGPQIIIINSLLFSLVFHTTVLFLAYIVETPLLFSFKWTENSLTFVSVVDALIFLIPFALCTALWIRLFKPHAVKILLWGGITTAISFALVYAVYYLIVDRTNLFYNWIAEIDIFYLLYLYIYPILCFVVFLIVWFISLLYFYVRKLKSRNRLSG